MLRKLLVYVCIFFIGLQLNSYIIFFVMKLYTHGCIVKKVRQIQAFFSLDIINGVSANWLDALRQHQQQTSLPCLRSMIFSPVSFFLLLLFVQQRCFSSDCTHFPCHPQQFVYGVFRCCPRASIVDSTCEWMRFSVVYLGMWGIWGFTMHLFSNKATNKRSSQEQFCSTLVHFALPCTEQKEYAYRVMTYVNMQIYI